jgi:hypothetical protein
MAKYSKGASKKVGRAMHEMKEGKLKSGKSGGKVKNRKQAIAIGLSEAREEGAKVPKKKTASKKTATKKKAAKKSATKKSAGKKRATAKKKSPAKKKSAGRKRTTRKKSTSR